MRTRIYNAIICTMEKNMDIQEGEVWVDGNRIEYIGSSKPSEKPFDKEINAEGNLLLPGFKNAHTHSAMTFLRSYADDLPLLDWLEKQVFPMEAKLTADDVYWLSKLAILEYLTSGITANFDMYSYPEMGAKASVDMGFRTVLCGVLHNFIGSLEELEQDYIKYNNHHELLSAQLSFHAEYTCSKELLQGVAAIAEKYKAPVYTHNSESKREVDECIERTGMTPTAYLDSIGIYNHGGGGFHCVHMTQQDLEILKNRGVYVVSNPGSNCKLASGIAPVQQMLEMGIPVALGTDGPASNNCLDMFREMFLVTALQKLANKDASALHGDTVLQMACSVGARVMGLNECDCLAPGKLADIIMIDLQQPNMQPINSLTRNLVYSGSKQNVLLTMVNGKVLYEKGAFFVGCSAEEIYTKANEITRRIQNEVRRN